MVALNSERNRTVPRPRKLRPWLAHGMQSNGYVHTSAGSTHATLQFALPSQREWRYGQRRKDKASVPERDIHDMHEAGVGVHQDTPNWVHYLSLDNVHERVLIQTLSRVTRVTLPEGPSGQCCCTVRGGPLSARRAARMEPSMLTNLNLSYFSSRPCLGPGSLGRPESDANLLIPQAQAASLVVRLDVCPATATQERCYAGPPDACSGIRLCPETTFAASSTRTGSVLARSGPSPGCRAPALPLLMPATPRLQSTTAAAAPPSDLPRVRRWLTRCALARWAVKARASARSIGRSANPVATPTRRPAGNEPNEREATQTTDTAAGPAVAVRSRRKGPARLEGA